MSAFAGKHVLIIVENLPLPFDRRVWQEANTLKKAGANVSVSTLHVARTGGTGSTLNIPANTTLAVTRLAAKARNFERKEFITETTVDMEIIAMSVPALSCHEAQSRCAGLQVDRAVAGRCRIAALR